MMRRELSVSELEPGMIVSRDVYGARGQLLIKEGVCLTETYIRYLKRQGVKYVMVSNVPSYLDRDDGPYVEHIQMVDNYFGHEDEETLSGPEYVTYFHRELISDLPRLCRKVLTAPCFGPKDVKPILNRLVTIIREPNVLDGLLKIRLTEESALAKAVQVAILAIVMGRKMGLNVKELTKLTIGALLYDIGNFWIDRSLLLKPEVFCEEEKRIVEEHTVKGYQELKELFDEDIARVAYQHHERHDGSGYPCRLSKDDIDLYAKIVSICDVYLSLIMPRPFRQKYEPLEALEYIMGAGGSLFDPKIVSVFLDIIPLYSVGSMVELSNQCIGMVIDTKGKPLGRPVVQILFDESGQEQQDTVLDLKEHLTLSIKRIL